MIHHTEKSHGMISDDLGGQSRVPRQPFDIRCNQEVSAQHLHGVMVRRPAAKSPQYPQRM